jgi:hypothetical protein
MCTGWLPLACLPTHISKLYYKVLPTNNSTHPRFWKKPFARPIALLMELHLLGGHCSVTCLSQKLSKLGALLSAIFNNACDSIHLVHSETILDDGDGLGLLPSSSRGQFKAHITFSSGTCQQMRERKWSNISP